jgi:Fe-S cluster assembly protein SufD
MKPPGAASRPSCREESSLNRFTADASTALPGPDWLRARRAAAFERFAGADVPTEAEEVWRYSRISDLDLDAFAPVTAPPAPTAELPAAVRPLLDAIGERAGLVVTVDGWVVHAEGTAVPALSQAPDGDERLHAVARAGDFFGDLHTAFLPDGVLVRIPRGTVVERPVVIVHWVATAGAAVFPHLLVEAGEASEATVIEIVASEADAPALVVPLWELDVHQAANLRYLNVQQLGAQAWQVGYQAGRVARDGTLHSSMVALGGDYARVRADSRLEGEGATSNLLAVYFGDGTQMHDFRTMQDHEAPKTYSDLLFKGAVEDRARGVYTGLIRVRKGAAGTRAFQTNRNLVLDDGASAHSVPNLEIEENDVSCSHASAVGPVDADQRYYLESRGVPTDVAERLIVLGFFDDVLDRTPAPGLRAALRRQVAAKLDSREGAA